MSTDLRLPATPEMPRRLHVCRRRVAHDKVTAHVLSPHTAPESIMSLAYVGAPMSDCLVIFHADGANLLVGVNACITVTLDEARQLIDKFGFAVSRS